MPDEIVFDESEVIPIVADVPSSYDGAVVDGSVMGRPPSAYDGTVVFDESEVEPIVGAGPSAYDAATGWQPWSDNPSTPDPSSYDETLVAQGPGSGAFPTPDHRSPYDGAIQLAEADEGASGSPRRRSTYDRVIVFDESEVEPILGRRRRAYAGVVVPTQVISFPESEGEVIQADPPKPTDTIDTSSLPLLGRGPLRRGNLSFELSDAWDLPRPSRPLAGMSEAELQVISWLEAHRAKIVDVERRRRIDRRAIAAAIAWEALENAWPFSRRAVGVAKVHTKSAVVRQVEAAGYLPRRSDQAREALLRMPDEAIEYVGAIMAAQADIAAEFGYDIRRDVPILTNEFNGRDLEQWREHLSRKKPGSPLAPGNRMGLWARENLSYVEFGVGTPDHAAFTRP